MKLINIVLKRRSCIFYKTETGFDRGNVVFTRASFLVRAELDILKKKDLGKYSISYKTRKWCQIRLTFTRSKTNGCFKLENVASLTYHFRRRDSGSVEISHITKHTDLIHTWIVCAQKWGQEGTVKLRKACKSLVTICPLRLLYFDRLQSRETAHLPGCNTGF